MSIKRIYLTRRNPAIAAADFPREWRRHAALAASFSKVKGRYTRVAQCTKYDAPGAPGNDYAGVALLSMPSLEIALEVNDDPDVIERLRPDEVRVFGMEVVHCAMFTEEQVLLDTRRPSSVVLIEFLRRAPGSTPQDFLRAWQAHGERIAARAGAGIVSLSQDRVVRTPPPGYAFDGVSETWFDSEEAAAAHLAPDGEGRRIAQEREAYCDGGGTVVMPTRVTHAWAAAA